MLWAQHMVALDSAGYGALIRPKHTAPYYRHIPWFGFNPPCWIKSIIQKFQLSNMLSLAPNSVKKLGCRWPLATLNFSAACKPVKHRLFIISCSHQARLKSRSRSLLFIHKRQYVAQQAVSKCNQQHTPTCTYTYDTEKTLNYITLFEKPVAAATHEFFMSAG